MPYGGETEGFKEELYRLMFFLKEKMTPFDVLAFISIFARTLVFIDHLLHKISSSLFIDCICSSHNATSKREIYNLK